MIMNKLFTNNKRSENYIINICKSEHTLINLKALSSLICITLFLSVLSPPVLAQERLKFTSIKGAYIQKISANILKKAYARLGIEFDVSWQPAERALKSVSSGESDGEISRVGAIAKLYPELIKIKIPVNFLEGMVFSKNPDISVTDWSSISKYKIGINRGIKFAEKGTKGMNVQLVSSFSSLFQMLDKDRVDVIVSPRIIGLFQITRLKLKGISAIEPPLVKLNQYHYLHKRHSELATRLEVILKEMKDKIGRAHV